MNIFIVTRDPSITTPTQAHKGDAGIDLRYEGGAFLGLAPGETGLFPTGLSFELPPTTVGMICPRSGLALKSQITVANAPGIVDSSYRGEVMVILHNFGHLPFTIDPKMRIAQFLIVSLARGTPRYDLVIADALSHTDRGADGFGSTGDE